METTEEAPDTAPGEVTVAVPNIQCPLCGTRPTMRAGQGASGAAKTFREQHRCVPRVKR